MYTFKDPTGATRTAVYAVACYAGFDLLASFAAYLMPPDPAEFGLADIMVVVASLVGLASVVLVGRWIYRANANAHSFNDEAMSITPGWAVGWFFVPIANLVKPYRAMKEVWIASHQAAGQYQDMESSLVRWWWGLWIGTNIAATGSLRMQLRSPEPIPALAAFDIFVSIANVALCVVLIQLMKRLSQTQLQAHRGSVFR